MAQARTLHSLSVRGIVIPAALMFVAVAWWAGRGAVESPDAQLPAADHSAPQPAASDEAGGNTPVALAPVDGEPDADASLESHVAGKYRFLFVESGFSKEASARLSATLLARERIAVAINTARQSSDPAARDAIPGLQAELDGLDRKVGTLLHPKDLGAFDVLKDSDIEQFQLEDFAGGVNGVAPLSDADRKSILYTKLAYRQRFRQVLADSRLMRGDLNAAERRIVFADVSRALEASRDSYLQEVRQYLYDDEQFALLRNYESTEFSAELEKLRRIADGE